jgi:hypothetical protein
MPEDLPPSRTADMLWLFGMWAPRTGGALYMPHLWYAARAIKRRMARKNARSQWVRAIKGRHSPHIPSVAVANKHERIFWAFLVRAWTLDWQHRRTITP